MDSINFTSNPNGKLFNDIFGEIRLRDSKHLLFNEFQLEYRGQVLGTALVEFVSRISVGHLSDSICLLTTGKTALQEMTELNRRHNFGKELPPHTLLHLLIFRYTERNIENQNILMKDWWESKINSHIS